MLKGATMEERVKIYVWLPAGITIPCQCGSRGCKCCRGNYGHAAMSIPYVDEVKSLPLLKEYANEIKEYPLYLSLVEKKLKNTAQNSRQYVNGGFNNAEEDSERYGEKYHAYVISLPCTKKEIITLWRSFLEKLQIKEKPLLDVGNYNVPDILIGGREGHNIIFSLYANSSTKEDNCTTFIIRLLKEVGIEGLKFHCSSGAGAGSTAVLQILGGTFAGYNFAVAAEICAVCLPKQTESIQISSIANIIGASISMLMVIATLLNECFCLPFARQRWPERVKQITQCARTPLSVLIPLPLFLINLFFFIYIASFHSQHHELMDSASVIGGAIGAIAAVILLIINVFRHIHTDTHHYIVRPEALLDLFPEEVKKLEDPNIVFVEEAGDQISLRVEKAREQIFTIKEAPKLEEHQTSNIFDGEIKLEEQKPVQQSKVQIFSLTLPDQKHALDLFQEEVKKLDSNILFTEEATTQISPITKTYELEESLLLSDTFDNERKIIKLEKQKPIQKSNKQNTAYWNGYSQIFSKLSNTLATSDSSEDEAGETENEDSESVLLKPTNEEFKMEFSPT